MNCFICKRYLRLFNRESNIGDKHKFDAPSDEHSDPLGSSREVFLNAMYDALALCKLIKVI